MQERCIELGLRPNGFSFDGMDAPGMDYALNRWGSIPLSGPSNFRDKPTIDTLTSLRATAVGPWDPQLLP